MTRRRRYGGLRREYRGCSSPERGAGGLGRSNEGDEGEKKKKKKKKHHAEEPRTNGSS